MGTKRGFIAFDPELAKEKFNSDIIIAIYYKKLLNCEEILSKDPNGFFTVKSQTMEKLTCIKRRQQDRARKWLEHQGYILTLVKIPEDKTAPQVHFKIVDNMRIQ